MFKNNWEKTEAYHHVDDHIIKAMIHKVFPHEKILFFQIVSGGCANLNIKFSVGNGKTFLLRIYVRDRDAAYREQNIAKLLKQLVPVPQFYYIGDVDTYRYAITEFMTGIPLRDFLLEDPDNLAMATIMYDCGKMLAAIAHHTFEKSGFFDGNLHIEKKLEQDDYQKFIIQCLQHPNVIKQLSQETMNDISNLVQKHSDKFPDQVTNLVHGDYDPANILINKQGDQWKISAVLDFEFVFSGSWLCDVSNMLRYAYKMPPKFEASFLQGITDAGFILPKDWRITIHLLNLVSLLDCLTRSSVEDRPHQVQDICEIIDYIVQDLQNNYE